MCLMEFLLKNNIIKIKNEVRDVELENFVEEYPGKVWETRDLAQIMKNNRCLSSENGIGWSQKRQVVALNQSWEKKWRMGKTKKLILLNLHDQETKKNWNLEKRKINFYSDSEMGSFVK